MKAKALNANSLIFFFYAFSLFMVMSMDGHLSFTWDLPESLILGFGIIVPVGYMLMYSKNSIPLAKYPSIVLFVVLFYLYVSLFHFSLINFLVKIGVIICLFSILKLPIEKKERLLSILKTLLAIVVGISIVAWILYLMGFPMSYEYVDYDDFHQLYKYRFFNMPAYVEFFIFPRFSGMFLEAGQLAESCALILIADGGNWKDWRNIVLLIGIILTFSLVGFALFLMWYLYKLAKKGTLLLILVVTLLGAASIVTFRAANEENVIYTYILSRLEYDEDSGIVGNNRVNDYADSRFKAMMKSSDCIFGISSTITKGNDWTYNTSGYKKFIIHYGLVGFALILLMVYCFYSANKSRDTLVYLLITIVAFLPRNLLQSPMWIFPVLLGFFILKKQSDEAKAISKTMVKSKKRLFSKNKCVIVHG